MEDRGADVARQPRELVVGLELHARLDLARRYGRQRRLRDDAPRDAQRIGGDRRSSAVLR
jgi:hypothetical protein